MIFNEYLKEAMKRPETDALWDKLDQIDKDGLIFKWYNDETKTHKDIPMQALIFGGLTKDEIHTLAEFPPRFRQSELLINNDGTVNLML